MEEVAINIDDVYRSSTFITGVKKPLIIVSLLNSPAYLCMLLASISIFSISFGLLWKWFLFLLLICSTQLLIAIFSYLVEQVVVIKKHKALFLVFAIKRSLDYFLWSASILFSWFLLTKSEVDNTNLIHFITTTIAACVIWTGMCTLKIVILKVLACRFHDKDFFHNIKDFIFQEHVLQTLLRGVDSNDRTKPPLKSIKSVFFKMLQLVHSTTSFTNTYYDVSEHQVDAVVSLVFKNLTNTEPRDIQETDLLRVMREEDIATVLNLFQGATATKCINQVSLHHWMVKVCNDRKTLLHLLNNTTTVIKELNFIVSITLLFLVAVLWYLLMGFGSTKFLVCVSSHLLALVFIMCHYCNEGIKLAFVMHPFNIGDHCIIDNEQLVVEDISLFKTVFLRENNEVMTSSNSFILSKSIINLNRSSLTTDILEFVVSGTSSAETIAALKHKMDELVGDKSWWGGYSLDLKGIEDVKHTYVLEVTHITNFENYKQKKSRKSKLVFELCKFFQELNIMDFSLH